MMPGLYMVKHDLMTPTHIDRDDSADVMKFTVLFGYFP